MQEFIYLMQYNYMRKLVKDDYLPRRACSCLGDCELAEMRMVSDV